METLHIKYCHRRRQTCPHAEEYSGLSLFREVYIENNKSHVSFTLTSKKACIPNLKKLTILFFY